MASFPYIAELPKDICQYIIGPMIGHVIHLDRWKTVLEKYGKKPQFVSSEFGWEIGCKPGYEHPFQVQLGSNIIQCRQCTIQMIYQETEKAYGILPTYTCAKYDFFRSGYHLYINNEYIHGSQWQR